MVETMDLGINIETEETQEQYRERIEKAQKIAFRPFPKLGHGERVGAVEFKHRFREIRDAGYYVKSYSHMNRVEAKKYFEQIQDQIKADLRRPAYLDK